MISVHDYEDIGLSSVVYILHKGIIHKSCVARKYRWICNFL